MKNPNTVSVPSDAGNTSNDTPHQAEDAALKITAQYFADELLPYFKIEGEVDHVGPTETVHLELKKFYQDINLVMKDGSWIHFEFQCTDDKVLDDLRRFWVYEALTTYQHKVAVHTYVLYSGTIHDPVTEFTSGFNTYRVQPIIMKGHRAEEVFDSIAYKRENSIPLTKEDLVPLTLCPLMGGDIPQMERISRAMQIVRQSENTIPDAEKIEAVIYAMASKFLNSVELDQIKEEIKMTELGLLLYNDGIQMGKKEDAKNLFMNGASFELVRNSIKDLSDEVLHKIYDEVMAAKNA